jgi:twitching motility protein PilT
MGRSGISSTGQISTGPSVEEEEVLSIPLAGPRTAETQPADAVHIDELLQLVVEKNASDLHLAVGVPPIIRVDGDLFATNYSVVEPTTCQRIVYDILSDEQIHQYETTYELDCSYALHTIARFRVNVYRDRGSVAAAFRLIPAKIPTVRELALPLVLEQLSRKPRGLVLVTGPTGCGKSTTLAAMLGQINRERSVHIITIEDPVEYLHTHHKSIINQRELGGDTKGFAAALRAALREDPDVILVGEMRDLDTMELAIRAAETGHLVFSTVHTNNAASTVDRIVDAFPVGQQEQIRIMLSNTLEAVVSQQLMARAGMPGRIAAVEVMIASAAIRNLIREAKAHQITSIIQTSAHLGMQTMDQALKDLYQRGLITYEDAVSRAMNVDELKRMLFTQGTEEKA